ARAGAACSTTAAGRRILRLRLASTSAWAAITCCMYSFCWVIARASGCRLPGYRRTFAGAMRFATWNINGFKARRGYFLRWLDEIRPDVLGIQELKMASDQFPVEELAGLGYSSLVHGQKGWNGVAV